MSWHNLQTKKTREIENSKEYLQKVAYNKIITKKASQFSDIVNNDLIENVQYRLITSNSFNAICVLQFLKEKHEITEIYIAIYRMNLKSVNFLKDFIKENKVTGKIVLSSFFRENKNYERWCVELISFSKDNDKIDVLFTWNHAKVFLAKTTCGKHIVFEGSGNLSDNARIEQYVIENNKAVYNFHKKWITEI